MAPATPLPVGTFTDNPVLYFNQSRDRRARRSPLFQNACTAYGGHESHPECGGELNRTGQAWADHLFDNFRNDVHGGKLPHVSWLIAPAGYSEHPDFPPNYGAWYISQILDILVSNPEVWSKTVLLVNYDENDGGFDHSSVPPTPPQTSANGALNGQGIENASSSRQPP